MLLYLILFVISYHVSYLSPQLEICYTLLCLLPFTDIEVAFYHTIYLIVIH